MPDNKNSPSAAKTYTGSNGRVLINVTASYISKFADLLIALLLIPFMVANLGDTDYGLWILVGSVVAYGSLLDFGVGSAVTKYISEYRARGTTEDARELIASALSLYCCIGAGIALLLLAIAPWFPVWFELEPNQHKTAIWLVILTGTGIGLSIPFAASDSVLKGLQRFEITSLLGTVRFLLFATGTVIVLLNDGGVLHIAAMQILSMCLIQIPAIWWIYRLAPEYRFGVKGASFAGLKTLASFSWSLFFVSIGGQLQSKTDEIVIGSRVSVGFVTPYSLALKLSQIPQMLADQFIRLVLPIASELHVKNDQKGLEATFIISTRLTLAVFLSFGVVLAVLAEPILALWVGSAYAEYAGLVWILVAALMFDTAQWPAVLVLQGMNRHQIFAVTSLITGIANVALSIALIPRFGLMGVALGTLIPAAIEMTLVIFPYAFRVIRVNPVRFLKATVLPTVLPSALMGVFLFIISTSLEISGIFSLIILGTAAILLYALIYLLYPANELERKLFIELLVEKFSL